MRGQLLGATAVVALLAATSAHAIDGTWQGPGADWTTGTNWSSTPSVPDNTATFTNNGAPTSVTFAAGTSTAINTILFTSGAPAYSFTLPFAGSLSITGAGIVNNSLNAPTFSVLGPSVLAFTNSSTAGNAIITNSGTSAVTQFSNSSSAANATITNTNNGFTSFNDSSTAGNASITSGSGGFASFLGSSTAGNATLTANFRGFTTFSNSSSAGNATIITNLGGTTSFANSSTAGNATLTTNNGGTTLFTGSSTAGNASVLTASGGATLFSQFSTGGNAAFTTQAGGVFDMSGLSLFSPGMTAGSIEGAGSYFLGSKTLTLTGNNLFAQVSGTIQDGGASGGRGGSLVKEGIGVLLLSGNNAYTGTTTVNAGALIVNGSIASSSLTTVNDGASLIASGSVGSITVNRGGFLVLGPGLVPGTMTVAGDLALKRDSLYVVRVNPQMASSINVSGSASLDGTVAAVFAPGNYLARS